jgi:hypothetical protein
VVAVVRTKNAMTLNRMSDIQPLPRAATLGLTPGPSQGRLVFALVDGAKMAPAPAHRKCIGCGRFARPSRIAPGS